MALKENSIKMNKPQMIWIWPSSPINTKAYSSGVPQSLGKEQVKCTGDVASAGDGLILGLYKTEPIKSLEGLRGWAHRDLKSSRKY